MVLIPITHSWAARAVLMNTSVSRASENSFDFRSYSRRFFNLHNCSGCVCAVKAETQWICVFCIGVIASHIRCAAFVDIIDTSVIVSHNHDDVAVSGDTWSGPAMMNCLKFFTLRIRSRSCVF